MTAPLAATEARPLSNIDRLVLQMLADGLTQQQIGRRCGWGRSAVAMRLHRIREQLGAATTVHAVVLAARAGYIGLTKGVAR